jgi:hypothetical protein
MSGCQLPVGLQPDATYDGPAEQSDTTDLR